MDLDYRDKGVVKVSMVKYLEKVLEEIPEELTSKSWTPAAGYLFQTRDPKKAVYLPEEQADIFHHTITQLLFMSARARCDTQTAVAFLTTRVKKPDEDDLGKLKRVLKYQKGTKYLKLTLSVPSLLIVQWWVDASYNVHDNCWGQTGGMMTLGRGAVISVLRKQKINLRS